MEHSSEILIPSNSPLPGAGAIYCHRVFSQDRSDSTGSEACLLSRLEELREELTPSTMSVNMTATRRFFNDNEEGRDGWVGHAIVDALTRRHPELGITRVLPDMRFIEYPVGLGAGIAPHIDGIMYDEPTGRESTTSFLLYLTTVEEGGTTTFLAGGKWGDKRNTSCSGSRDGERGSGSGLSPVEVIAEVAPVRGSILVFPHLQPHEGTAVYDKVKWLLRGDCY